jgi:hypothetical protein
MNAKPRIPRCNDDISMITLREKWIQIYLRIICIIEEKKPLSMIPLKPVKSIL